MASPRKPAALKLLAGNPGRRKVQAEPAPTVDPALAEPPAWILPGAAVVWRELAPELVRLGVLAVTDVAAFGCFCTAIANAREAERLASELPPELAINGGFRRWALAERGEIYRWAKRFGCDPGSRSSVSASPPQEPADRDAKFFGPRRPEPA